MSHLANKLLIKPVGEGKTYAKFSTLSERKSSSVTLSNAELTALNTGSVYKGVYLNIDKTSGLWAIEINLDSAFNLTDQGFSIGLTDTFVLSADFGRTTNSVGFLANNGSHRVNNANTIGYWDIKSGQGTKVLVVFNLTSRKMLIENSGVLKLSSAVPGTNPLFIGISLYYSNTNARPQITLNSGQSGFSAANEALIAAYELANSVTINRGLWL